MAMEITTDRAARGPVEQALHQKAVTVRQRLWQPAVTIIDRGINISSSASKRAAERARQEAEVQAMKEAAEQAEMEKRIRSAKHEQERKERLARLDPLASVLVPLPDPTETLTVAHVEPLPGINMNAIIEHACKAAGMTLDVMIGTSRKQEIVLPRQIAMFLCRALLPSHRCSQPQIGRRFGGRDHTTVLHALRKVEALASEDSYASFIHRVLLSLRRSGAVRIKGETTMTTTEQELTRAPSRESLLPYVSYCLDDALSERNIKDMPANARLVAWQCGFEPMVVAVWSYLGDTQGNLDQVDVAEAEEIATDFLQERRWFTDNDNPPPADYVI